MSHRSRFRASGTGRRSAMALATAATVLAAVPAIASAADARIEGETLVPGATNISRIASDANASAGKTLKIYSNGAASSTVRTSSPATALVVRARGQQCGGAPKLEAYVDGSLK